MARKLLLGSLGLAVGIAVTAATGGSALPVLGTVIGGTLAGGVTEGVFYTAANLTNGE